MIVASWSHAEALLAPLFTAAEVERVAVLHLGPERTLIGLTLEGVGSDREVELPVGRILASAVKLGAAGIVVAHNHPSGDPRPSHADEEATRSLHRGAELMGIRLHDHLIFAGGECRSFAALGLL